MPEYCGQLQEEVALKASSQGSCLQSRQQSPREQFMEISPQPYCKSHTQPSPPFIHKSNVYKFRVFLPKCPNYKGFHNHAIISIFSCSCATKHGTIHFLRDLEQLDHQLILDYMSGAYCHLRTVVHYTEIRRIAGWFVVGFTPLAFDSSYSSSWHVWRGIAPRASAAWTVLFILHCYLAPPAGCSKAPTQPHQFLWAKTLRQGAVQVDGAFLRNMAAQVVRQYVVCCFSSRLRIPCATTFPLRGVHKRCQKLRSTLPCQSWLWNSRLGV